LISRGLVVFQIVVTCVLLIGSLLQLRSILNQQTIDFGYDTNGILSARMGLMDGDYPTPAARKQFYDRLVRDLGAESEFDAVGLTNRFLMVFSGSGPLELEGKEYKNDRDRPNANSEQVTGGFFAVMSQKLLAGRTFKDDDLDARQPVAVINAAFAQKHFGNASALGRRFRTFDPNRKQPGPWRTIVGVVSTVRMLGPFNNPGVDDTGFYVPFYSTITGPVQPDPFVAQFATVVVKPRPGQRADALANVLRRAVSKADANLPLYFVGTPKTQLESFVAQNRIIATMFLMFGAVAVVLASVGIYGVMSFAVNQRTQEFGVRMALGASDGRIVSMVLRQGVVQIVLGLALGLGAALGLAAVMGNGVQTALFGVSARDPLTYSAVATLIAVVSLTATLVPARRASRVDPMAALRAE
jgi:predicted permease